MAFIGKQPFTSQFTVAPNGSYTTVQSAIDAAHLTADSSSAETVWIWPGEYNEDLVLYPWVNLAAASDPSDGAGVLIIGNATYSDPETGNISISNIGFVSSTIDAAISFQSASTSQAHLQACYMFGGDGIGFECTGSSMEIQCNICTFAAASGGKCINVSNGIVQILSPFFSYVDTASTISGGTVRISAGNISDSFNVTGGILEAIGSTIHCSSTASCISIGASGTVDITQCALASTGSYVVSGTGSLSYALITSISGGKIDPGLGITNFLPMMASISFDRGVTTLNPVSQAPLNRVLLGTGTSALSAVGTGSNAQVLTLVSGVPEWQNSSSAVVTIAGDTGSATGTTITFSAKNSGLSGSTITFNASGAEVDLNLMNGSANMLLGNAAGNLTVSGTNDNGYGANSLHALTSGNYNSGFGDRSLPLVTTGSSNTAVGSTQDAITSGSFNCLIGYQVGTAYVSSESHNILINSVGVVAESNVLRIGATTGTSTKQLNKAFIQGIYNNNSSGFTAPLPVFIDSTTGQLGYGSLGGSIVNQTATTVTMAVNTTYEINAGASLVTLTLPATSAVGDIIKIVGQSSGGWKVVQGSGQSIKYSPATTTTTTGSLASTAQYDVMLMHCVIANATWNVEYSTGTGLTIV